MSGSPINCDYPTPTVMNIERVDLVLHASPTVALACFQRSRVKFHRFRDIPLN
jgi:hypothetical protein